MLQQAVILVGGEGTRLRPLSYHMPKSMMPVLNRPFLEHTLAYLKNYGVSDVILTLSYLPEVIQGYLGNGSNLGIRLSYAVEDIPLGTAGAVKNTEPHLADTFAVLNGDIFTDLDLADLVTFHRHKGAQATIALTYVDNPSAFGVVETESDGRVRRFIEKPSPDQITSHWINAGIYILEPEVLRHVPQNSHYMFERGLFPRLLELDEPVYGYPFRGYWLDMGTPEKYLRLSCDLLRAEATSYLCPDIKLATISHGADVIIHPSAKISGPAIIGSQCRIDQRVRIKGPVVMGEGCHIGKGASLESAVLWPGVSVETGASLKQCVICYNKENMAQIISCSHSQPC
jgi:mannose-1-phosphate guanylyltransferase